MKNIFFVFFLLLNLGLCYSFDLKPKINNKNVIEKDYAHFTVYYNQKNKIPECVYYKINNFKIKYLGLRKFENFRQDKWLKTASLVDYYKSGYDKGHLFSAETASFCIEALYDCNYMSNVAPQEPAFNRGFWKKLENFERERILKDKELYIISGCIAGDPVEYMAGTDVVVPKYFYKVFLDYKNPIYKSIAFLVENKKVNEKISVAILSVNELEEKTGIDFFYGLSDDIEEGLESQMIWDIWDI